MFYTHGESGTKKIIDAYLRTLNPQEKQLKITIGEGLTFCVSPKGKKTWYVRYYLPDGSWHNAKLGEYPALSLKEAMLKADQLKSRAKTEGVNLARAQKQKLLEKTQAQSGSNCFEAVGYPLARKKTQDWEARHAKRNTERLTANVFPVFGHLPINDITLNDVDAALRVVLDRGARETAQRICTLIISVFEYADLIGLMNNLDIITRLKRYRKDMPKPKREDVRHLYKEMDDESIGKLMFAIEDNKDRWTLSTSVALQLAPYVLLRPGELCAAEWTEIDLDKREWFIPGRKTKNGNDHIVPLPSQAVTLLKNIHPWSGRGQYVFPSSRPKGSIGTFTLVQALRRMGYGAMTTDGDNSFTTHGFRGLASTLLHQKLKYPSDYIELHLNHVEQNKVKAAYNRISPRSFLEERREMLQRYANFFDELRNNNITLLQTGQS